MEDKRKRQRAYEAKYKKKNIRFYTIQFSKKTDAEIVEYLDNLDNFGGNRRDYLRQLILKDMKEKGLLKDEG